MADTTRRFFVLGGAGLLVSGCAHQSDGRVKTSMGGNAEKEDEVSPAEDLMREHGVLNRLLLVYEEVARRAEAPVGGPLPMNVLASAADIVRSFIEQYHEKLEEEFLFPRFEKASEHVDLVSTLRRQHAAGRKVTDNIMRIASGKTAPDRTPLVAAIGSFVRMYRPHEAREDTVLFPAFRKLVSDSEYRELGERFEDREHQLFGKEGFEGIVAKVAALESDLGIHELNQFTPAV